MKKKTGIICQVIVINNKGEILLLKRDAEDVDGPCSWNFPGGKLEFGESPEECALRELKEETKLKPIEIKLIKIINYTYEKLGKKVHLMRFFYLTKIKNKVKLNNEHSEYSWKKIKDINLEEFPGYVREVFDALRLIL